MLRGEKKFGWNFQVPASICLERYYNKNSQFSQQFSIVMFNYIITLNNVIAIIVLFEERNLRKRRRKNRRRYFFKSHIHTYTRARSSFSHVCVFQELLMSDDTEIEWYADPLTITKKIAFWIVSLIVSWLKSYYSKKSHFLWYLAIAIVLQWF